MSKTEKKIKNTDDLKFKFMIFIYILIIFFVLIVPFPLSIYMRFKYENIYNDGKALLKQGKVIEAYEKFQEIPDYEDYKDIKKLMGIPNVCPECGQEIKEED